MALKSIVLAATTLVLSISVNAAQVTQGYLTSYDDGSTNIITDSLNNVEYLRLNVLRDFNYASTLAVLGTQDGGGWSIATSGDAIAFANALLGGSLLCSHNGTDVVSSGCGFATGWVDGKLGDDYSSVYDFAWFLDDAGEADYLRIASNGGVALLDFNLTDSDQFAAGGTYDYIPVTWLLTRPAVVPVPAAIWLFGSGFLGLIGIARRKARV